MKKNITKTKNLMKKIINITVRNLKNVSEQDVDLRGASIIMTAGNDVGKSTVLKTLIDRFHGHRPKLIVKEGQRKGAYYMDLSDGSSIEWTFTNKSENLIYITSDGLKVSSGVLSEIGRRYFGEEFDLNKFLNMSANKQQKELERVVGLDFSKLDEEYKQVYDERTEQKRLLTHLRSQRKTKPAEVKPIEILQLKKELAEIEAKNDELRKDWAKEVQEIQIKNSDILSENANNKHALQLLEEQYDALLELVDFKDAINFETANQIFEDKKMQFVEKDMLPQSPEPDYLPTAEIKSKIEKANEQNLKYQNYVRDFQDHEKWLSEGKLAKSNSEKLTARLEEIKEEKRKILKGANIPKEFELTDKGLLYNGFPLDSNQISTSAKYIAGLKLGTLLLGEVRAIHFEASALDNNNLKKVLEWANAQDLQLLIERPNFEGGEIEYKIVSEPLADLPKKQIKKSNPNRNF